MNVDFSGVISDGKLFTDKTRKIEEIPNALLELELVRITNQLIQIKAANLLKVKRIKEFTDILFVLEQELRAKSHSRG